MLLHINNMINVIKKFLQRSKKGKKDTAITLRPIDGHEEYRVPLSVINISFIFCTKEELLSSAKIQIIAEELNVDPAIVKEDLGRVLDTTISDFLCCIEYPYVEEYYRDSYYSFYSRKHKEYNRNCFRISFFKPVVTEENFYDIEMGENFLGYVVLRPTPKRIIGYTFLSPRIYLHNNYTICLCKRTISVMGRLLETTGFPFCGQDGEMNQCAENAIVILFDYFSRRYNKYSRVLPSQIADITYNNLSNRNQPSIGLDMDNVGSVIENMYMATRRYVKVPDSDICREDHKFSQDEFNGLLQIYIESGLPVYASTSTHAFLIVGRENKFFYNGAKVVCMNDNKKPYSFRETTDDIEEFIVPVAENILLNAEQLNPDKTISELNKLFPNICFLSQEHEYYHRIFLTTSRSYKAYLASSPLTMLNKNLSICTAMPRYIWVCESYKKDELQNEIILNYADLITIVDATDYAYGCNHLLMVKTLDKLIIPTTDRTRLQRKTYSIFDSSEKMKPFMRNLKGLHTSWQD